MYVMYWLTFLKISPELLISYFQQLRTYSFDAVWLNVAWGTTTGPQVIEQDQNTNEKLKFDLGTKLVKEMLPSKKT